MESFTRRVAETSSGYVTYQIDFYDIFECPPKVSVKVSSSSETFNIFGDTTTFDIVDKIDAVVEGKPN